MTLLEPYLFFVDECRDAMTFYQSVFGGDLELNTFGQFGMDGDPDKLLNATLRVSDDFTLMASDRTEGSTAHLGGSISITGADETTLGGWLGTLAEGGVMLMPLEKQVWGEAFGQCNDRFGVTWLINVKPAAQ